MSMLKFLSRRGSATKPVNSFGRRSGARTTWTLPDVRSKQRQPKLTKVGSLVQTQQGDAGMMPGSRVSYNNTVGAAAVSRAQLLSNGSGGSKLFRRQSSRPGRSGSNGGRSAGGGGVASSGSDSWKKSGWHSKRGGPPPMPRGSDLFTKFLRE